MSTHGSMTQSRFLPSEDPHPHEPVSCSPSPSLEKKPSPEQTRSSPSPSPSRETTGKLTKTPLQKRTSLLQFLALCWCLVVTGWNDGTTGPLLPRIREVYDVGYTVVSLLFVISCVGFISGAVLNMWLGPEIGLGKTLALGAAMQVITYSVQASAPPFPAFVAVNFLNGAGLALQDAQSNGFVAALSENAEAKMGILHAAYGIGALIAPLISTQFSQLPGKRWSLHYLVSLGLALSNTVFVVGVFRFRDQEEYLREAGEPVDWHHQDGSSGNLDEKRADERSETTNENENSPDESEKTTSTPTNTPSTSTNVSANSNFNQVMKTPAVHFLAFFSLVYVGVEVTIGGWIVTYIIEERNGGPSSGYISSGFYGGLTLGRIVLLWVNEKVGERLVVYIYTLLALGLELVVWLVPSLIGDAVAVSFVGLLLGPMYPIAMNHTSRILPRTILTSSIGWIAGFGQAGSALVPFITGTVAQRSGIWSLNPLLVGMTGALIVLWWVIPDPPKSPTVSRIPSAT